MVDHHSPSLLRARIIIPFLITGTIWGSTWFVITGQIGSVPAVWSVFYRFALAAPGMFLLAVVMRNRLRMSGRAHWLALWVGVAQFSGNFLFVYYAELYVTSGIVAVMFAMMMVPNAIFGRVFLGEKFSRSFMAGSAVAVAGVTLLLWHEVRTAILGDNVLIGIALAVGGILAAAIANVVQANEVGRKIPMVTLLAWAMLYGNALNLLIALIFGGVPPTPANPAYWSGILYLALIGSIITFPLHYNLVREIGAGRTAYNAIVTIGVAMLLSTLFEGYRWTSIAALGMVLAVAGMVLALRARRTRAVKVAESAALRHEAELP